MQRTKSYWTHREPRAISRWLLRVIFVLISLCLLAQLSGCGNSQTVYVPVPVVPIPASITADTPEPEIPESMTYGESVELNVIILSALKQANRDKADIRAIELNRSKVKAGGP